MIGVEESTNENCIEIVKTILEDKFDFEGEPCIERAHRDGRGKYGKPAHMLIKMLSYQSKVTIMKSHRTALTDSPMYILDDLTAADRKEKWKWKVEVKALYDQGTKLRFFAGKWRHRDGGPFAFNGN